MAKAKRGTFQQKKKEKGKTRKKSPASLSLRPSQNEEPVEQNHWTRRGGKRSENGGEGKERKEKKGVPTMGEKRGAQVIDKTQKGTGLNGDTERGWGGKKEVSHAAREKEWGRAKARIHNILSTRNGNCCQHRIGGGTGGGIQTHPCVKGEEMLKIPAAKKRGYVTFRKGRQCKTCTGVAKKARGKKRFKKLGKRVVDKSC